MLDFKGDRMLFKEPVANVFLSLVTIGGIIFVLDEFLFKSVGEDWEKPFEVNAYGTSDAAIEAMAMHDTLAALVGYD